MSRPLLGYTTEPVPSGRQDHHGNEILFGYRMVIVEEHAALVRRAYDLYLGGLGLKAIAAKLDREAVSQPRNPRGWSYSKVRTMLRNPTCKGLYIWNKQKHVRDPRPGPSASTRAPRRSGSRGEPRSSSTPRPGKPRRTSA